MAKTAPPARQRKLGRKQKKKIVSTKKLPSGWLLLKASLVHLWRHKKLFGGLFAIYLVLHLFFVRSVGADFKLDGARASVEEALGGQPGRLEVAGGMVDRLLNTAGPAVGEVASVYQLILFVLMSLVIIWLLRATYEQRTDIKLKAAVYNSTYPLIPYLLVGLVLLLQSLPGLLALSVHDTVISNALVIGALEQIIWTLVLLAGFGISVYLLSSSFLAAYIVTLPNTQPLASLRSARALVKYRRLTILRKVFFFLLVCAVVFGLIFLPLVLLAPIAAEILFFVVGLLAVFIMHAYFYTLYRELL